MFYRKIHRGNRKEQRNIMEDSNHIRFENIDMDVYIKDTTPYISLQIFSGKTKKPDVYQYFKAMEDVERKILERKGILERRLEDKEQRKIQKREQTKQLKLSLKPGTLVNARFSYNMTFNKFYKVISNKNNTYKLEVLGTDWVDGDIGYTGTVKAGQGTGEFVEGKLTSNGLKVKNLYASICSAEDTFYENHMD